MKPYELLSELVNQGEYINCARSAHETWKAAKESQGWTYGPRNRENKTNPLMVEYDDLPKETKAMNNVTPYAAMNFFRTRSELLTMPELEMTLDDLLEGNDRETRQELGEYIHSHFIAAALAQSETYETRDDMLVFENLDKETQSWDIKLGLDVARYLKNKLGELK